MSIEVTSVPEPGHAFSGKQLSKGVCRVIAKAISENRRTFLHATAVLIIVGLLLVGGLLLRSYNYYAQLIDARLASGYLTSRPGLYAAPRLLQVGQKLSQQQLIQTLRRAGYVQSAASAVWSGSFMDQLDAIEIRPNQTNRKQPGVVRVRFSAGQVSELTGDGITLDSFTLEPEALANDLSSKAGKREVLNYDDIPTVLVQAILSIEDRRFFDHAGVDLTGLVRAFL
jgi:penicillin-binding protein 1B